MEGGRAGTDAFVRIGEDVTETVERRPASLVVVRVRKPKFVPKGRDRAAETRVLQAPPPELPIDSLVQPDRLRARVLVWAEEEVRVGELPTQSGRVLEAILHRGELPRGEVDAIAGTGERQGRRILAALVEKGVLASEGARAPLHLAFPANLAQRWMPGLFPEQPNA